MTHAHVSWHVLHSIENPTSAHSTRTCACILLTCWYVKWLFNSWQSMYRWSLTVPISPRDRRKSGATKQLEHTVVKLSMFCILELVCLPCILHRLQYRGHAQLHWDFPQCLCQKKINRTSWWHFVFVHDNNVWRTIPRQSTTYRWVQVWRLCTAIW